MEEEKATFKQWLAVFAGVMGAFMAVLDISITNASLADIGGSLNASLDEGSWISTAYLIAEIVIIPLSAWFTQIFSLRRYLLVNTFLFLFFSICCGMAWDLNSMIFFRFFQGLTGGVLIPVAAYIIITVLPKSQRPAGLAMFGICATFAPALGPTIGGWLTVTYGWQYIFYLNIVPGALVVTLILKGIDKAPMKLGLLKNGDWWGIGTMAVGLACLTVVLEEGNRHDWFGSQVIVLLSVLSACSLAAFLIIEFRNTHPVVNLRLFKERNFALSAILSLSLGMGLYGSVYILPVYLSQIQNYDALQIGKVIMWVGFPQLLISPFLPRLIRRFDLRLLIGVGVGMFALSCYMNANLTNLSAGPQFQITQIVRALGQPLIMTPLQSIAYGGVLAQDLGYASGLFNMMRNLGGSVGIGILSTLLTVRYQFHFARITETISKIDPQVQARINSMTALFRSKGFAPNIAHNQALRVLYASYNREAYVMAFNDCFYFMTVTLIVGAVGLFFVRKVQAAKEAPVGH